MSEFPNAEPRKKLVITFDDEPEPTPAPPPARTGPAPAPPSENALWSGHSGGATPPPVPRMPPPAPAPAAYQPPAPAYSPPPAYAQEPPRMVTQPQPQVQMPPPAHWPPPPAPLGSYAAQPASGAYSSWGIRVVATLIDGVLAIVFTFLVMTLVGASIFGVGSGSDSAGAGAFVGALFAYVAVSLFWSLLYAPLTMMRQGQNNGQTFGKQIVGIRVARLDGQPVTAGTALLRDVVVKGFLIWGLGAFLFYIPGILDSLWPLGDARHQAWHDKAVATIVVDA